MSIRVLAVVAILLGLSSFARAADDSSDRVPLKLSEVAALAGRGRQRRDHLGITHTTGASFKLGAEDILFLKKNHVSDRVVIEMQNSRNRPEPIGMPMPMPMHPPLPMSHAGMMFHNPWMPMPAPAMVPNIVPAYYDPSFGSPMPQPSYLVQ